MHWSVNNKYFIVGFIFLAFTKLLFAHEEPSNFTLKGILYGKNNTGDEVSQYIQKNKRQFIITIREFRIHDEIDVLGKFTFELNKNQYEAGKKITLEVNKKGWHIVSPVDGVAYLPLESTDGIKIVLESNKPNVNSIVHKDENNFIYTIQTISTKNETEAIMLKKQLARENKFKKVYIEKFMVSNMPNNGFDYKVRIGEFKEKKDAEKLQYSLAKRYRKRDGFFVTLKGYK